MMRSLGIISLATVVACASQPAVPAVRFANAPPVTVVNDRRHVAKQPDEIEFNRYLHNFDALIHRRMTRPLELRRAERARGVNALDEVPNSTWFTNRIGVRDVPIEEVITRPGSVGSPEPHKPWTIESSKVGGVTVGFIMKDARGEKFLLKFDPKGHPEAETGTQVIMARLLWMFGYNVTDDYVVHLHKDDLVLAPDAVVKDGKGNKRPLDRAELEARLSLVEMSKDGKMRGLASHWLPGKPLGGHPPEGVRRDDPNDVIPHELRRDLRGAYVLFSWLDHIDLHGANRLDVLVKDPKNPALQYVKHYWIDFGIGLGFGATKNSEPRYGYEFHFDIAAVTRSLISFGLLDRPWERRRLDSPKGVGMLEIDAYDPGTWKAQTPSYVPIYVADRIDKFWASKIIMKMTRKHIRAAVESAKLSDPDATDWLTEALIARQRKTAKYWFDRVNPLDGFTITNDRLCFKDLSLVYGFEPPQTTGYTLHFFDKRGKRVGNDRIGASTAGAGCAALQLSNEVDNYTIVRIETRRPSFTGSTYVHVARDARGEPRVIGIWRP